MKSVLLSLFLSVFLLISCTSTSDVQTASNTLQSREELKSAFSSALVSTGNSVFQSTLDYTLDSTYQGYLKDLPQFRLLCQEYLEEARGILLATVPKVLDHMSAYLSDLRIINPADYLNKGYSSLTDEAERTEFSKVKAIFLEGLEENHDRLDEYYLKAENEASIWQNNLKNLSLVGQGQSIPDLERVNLDTLAAYATKEFFTLLSENEITKRSTQGYTQEET